MQSSHSREKDTVTKIETRHAGDDERLQLASDGGPGMVSAIAGGTGRHFHDQCMRVHDELRRPTLNCDSHRTLTHQSAHMLKEKVRIEMRANPMSDWRWCCLLIVSSLEISVAMAFEDQATVRFTEHLIADKYAYAYGIAAADFDDDGDLDLTSADYTPHNMLYLFENAGDGVFQQHVIQRDDPERLERHLVGDVDGDGDLDVVIVKNLRGHLLWFENDGSPADGHLWTRHVITTELPGAYDVALADFNQDGHLDVAASSWVLGNQFAWFENDQTPADGEWQKHMIEADVAETRTMRAADFDDDGDADLLGTVRQDHEVVWYENSRAAGAVTWTKHMIDHMSVCPAHGNPADMDGDGDQDVVMALGFYFKPDDNDPKASQTSEENQIVWYENDAPTVDGWRKHVIAPRFDDAFEAVAADLDGDGDIDVAGTSWRNPGRVAWFENHGDPKGTWTRHVLKDNWRSANQIIIADLNGDGRPDIAACAEHGSYEFRWWRNEGRTAQPE